MHAKTLKASVKGVSRDVVMTDAGNFSSQCIIDCTGWKAVLASSIRNDYVDRSKLAFGIESEVDYTDDSLHFFVDPDIIAQGAAWIFPIGQKSRIGVASYAEKPGSCRNFQDSLKHWGLKFQKSMVVIFHSVFVNLWWIIFSWPGIPQGWRPPRPAKEYASR